ncbi:hypothetical protein N0V90_004050 [Kalmusia sp. IMI 367209]|nr:hypothetical protein N0V90_004050 [Kalmusia sp. IMI 367209]
MDPENIAAVFSSKWEDWVVAPARIFTMEPFSGRGFITTDGDDWKRFRAMINPPFSDANVSDLSSLAEAFDEVLDSLPLNGNTVDLAPIFSELVSVITGLAELVLITISQFLDLSGDFLFGKRFSKMQIQGTEAPSRIAPHDFLQAFHAGGFWVGVRITFGWLGINFPNPWFWQNCRTVHCFVDDYVKTAMEKAKTSHEKLETNSTLETFEAESNSFVSGIVTQSSDLYELRAQVLQVLLASQDTVSTLLSNCVFLLSRHDRSPSQNFPTYKV